MQTLTCLWNESGYTGMDFEGADQPACQNSAIVLVKSTVIYDSYPGYGLAYLMSVTTYWAGLQVLAPLLLSTYP